MEHQRNQIRCLIASSLHGYVLLPESWTNPKYWLLGSNNTGGHCCKPDSCHFFFELLMHLVVHCVDSSYILKILLGSKENLATCRKKHWKTEEDAQEKLGGSNQPMTAQHEQMSLKMQCLEKG